MVSAIKLSSCGFDESLMKKPPLKIKTQKKTRTLCGGFLPSLQARAYVAPARYEIICCCCWVPMAGNDFMGDILISRDYRVNLPNSTATYNNPGCSRILTYPPTLIPWVTIMIITKTDRSFLEEMLSDVKAASTVHPRKRVGDSAANSLGFAVTRPGGRDCYPAFWIRDFAMSLCSGCIPNDELSNSIVLVAERQADIEARLPSGAIIPVGAIPDHITFDGEPIFFPGSYDPEDQGGEPWGVLPSLDDQYWFIDMAFEYVSNGGDAGFLDQNIKGKRLIDRLEEAYAMPPCDTESALIMCDTSTRGVSFGFTDSIYHTGKLLFTSLLKCRGARHLAEIFSRVGVKDVSLAYRQAYDKIQKAIAKAFVHSSGLLRSSTMVSCQPDVWATAFAVYEGLLPHGIEKQACEALLGLFKADAISWRGNIRHVPTTHDFSVSTSWERTAGGKKNIYQNGAYWGTPTGWVAYALSKADYQAACSLIKEFIAELREGDFRKGKECGSPWECMHPDGNHRQNPVYLTSVSCPMAALERIITAD